MVEQNDVVIILTKHSVFNYTELGEWAKLIIDTRNATVDLKDKIYIIKS